MSTSTVVQVTLSPEDIDSVVISKPYDKHTTAALRWWLLCRGIKPPQHLGIRGVLWKGGCTQFCWDFYIKFHVLFSQNVQS